jgi:DNA-binding PadR family transcriptional regulator
MPKAKSFITVAEYAVLGLLRDRPAHGYDLQRYLSGRHGLGLVCPVEPAMVYAILKSLSGLELINGEWDNTTYPPKAIYSVTEAGDAEFQRWLMRPVGRMREIRQDLMVKLYFLINSETDSELSDARQLIDQQVDVCEVYAKEIEAELEGVPQGSFDALALGSKLSAARMTRTWLLDSVKVLESSRRGHS